MQKPEQTLPVFWTTDAALNKLEPNESPFLKGVESNLNANPESGSNNPTGEGQNTAALTPTRSNVLVPGLLLPAGYNKFAGSFESKVLRETYIWYYNDQQQHSIWLLSGDTGLYSKIVQDPNLPITSDQADFMADCRPKIRVIYDSDGNVIEKFLLFANKSGWQGWINSVAAIATQGFNAALFPYYTLVQPHFDRRELLEWPVRPPMLNPVITALANTPADADKVNRTVDQAFQFCFKFNNTDGRYTTASPYSLPYINKTEQFLSDPDLLPKNAQITLYAGSCMVESIDIYVRFTAKKQAGIPSTVTWGDWMKYDRIYKFTGATGNPSDVLGTQYWLRTNPWANYSYDPIQNTIQYIFDNSRLPELVDQNFFERLQNDIPIKSIALTDLGDAVALGDNLVGYPNLPFGTVDNIDVEVEEKTNITCPLATRKIRLYAYIGRPSDNYTYESQVGFYVGTDTQMRWGTITVGPQTLIQWDESQSKAFGLDFADHSAFVCYAKGTPFYSVGTWYTVNYNNVITKLENLLDFSNSDVLSFCQTVFSQQGYFMCVFDFEVPAGRYNFAIGRHNVNLSGNFRGLSTYTYGIADSRNKSRTPVTYPAQFLTSIKPNAIVSYSKEMEIDCTAGDVDVWGNGQDLFYIFCPYPKIKGKNSWRFIEGYFKESGNNPIGIELTPYDVNVGAVDWGRQTDKNGFYWAYTPSDIADTANIEVTAKFNCTYPFKFEIPSGVPGSIGWFQEGDAYLSDHNGGVVGDCNRVLVKGKIVDITGLIPYANIAVSIKDGATTLTQQDGTFILIVHDPRQNSSLRNMYVNSSGNFLITLADCGFIPLFPYSDILASCADCTVRNYPFPINLNIVVQGGTQESLKENGTYNIGVAVADLAGRLGFVNLVKVKTVPTFVQRQDILATFLRMFFNGPLAFMKDFKWFAPYVTNTVNIQRFFQWVGDSIQYIDNAGNVVDDPSSAVFCSIAIDSFYNYAVAKNFSILATYQFSPDDRIRIMDNGDNQLFPTGQEIDLQVLGTNYNQAAMAANIIPPNTNTPIINNTINNTVNNTVNNAPNTTPTSTTTAATQKNNISITLYVKYDSRLDALKDKTGFWIEIFTPVQQAQEVQYNELQWYPIINGEVAIFKNIVNGFPVFDFPKHIDISFWDTYLFFRSITIPNVGDKYIGHPFESPNISDSFGANVSSGGRKWEKNDDAAQRWIPAQIIPSDDFIGNGIINGLGTFRAERAKDFGLYPVGPIQAMITQRSVILIICLNDWLMVNFDFHFTFPNPEGVMVTNLDGDISKPAQKIGSNYGLMPDDIGTVVVHDKTVQWYDRRNGAWVVCDYRNAEDVSDIKTIRNEEPIQIGIKSYLVKKSQFISNWNNAHTDKDRFDVVAGVDSIRKNVYITFRPRRNNSNDVRSYINRRRNISYTEQETIVYNITSGRWTRMAHFTPEGYAEVKGTNTGIEFIAFAAGQAYFHNSVTNNFLNFFGQQTEPVIACVFNKPAGINKILTAISYDTNDSRVSFYADLIYTSMFNSFSYIPLNYLKLKSGDIYSQALRDMNSYPPIAPELQYLSMLQDGKRIYDTFMVIRLVGSPQVLSKYFQLNRVYALLMKDNPVKK